MKRGCSDCNGAKPCLRCAPSGWWPSPKGSRAEALEMAKPALEQAGKCPLCDIRMVPLEVGITLQCTYCKGTWQEPL